MITDWCATCEKPLVRLRHGSYRLCCPGSRYWSTFEPLPRDNMIRPRRARGTITGVLVHLYEPLLNV